MSSLLQRAAALLHPRAEPGIPRAERASDRELLEVLKQRTAAELRTDLHVDIGPSARAPRQLSAVTVIRPKSLLASQLSDGSLLMAAPDARHLHPFGQVCLEETVSRVVDLRSDRERNHGPRMPVALSVIPVDVQADAPIPPRQLLQTSLHLAEVEPRQGGRTLFQCADGRHVSATFAAALGLLRRHLKQGLEERDLPDAVLRQCLDIRRDRGLDLFRACDLVSLMAFCRLLIEADRSGALQGLHRPRPLLGGARPTLAQIRAQALQARAPRSILKPMNPGGGGSSSRHVSFARTLDVRLFVDGPPRSASGDGASDSEDSDSSTESFLI